MSEYHILSNVNQSYLVYLFVMYQSILDSLEESETNESDRLVFHVLLDSDVNLETAHAQAKAFSELNADSKVGFTIKFYKVDASIFNNTKIMSRDGLDSRTAYYRILFARVLPEDISQVLYIDVDLVVCEDIRHIFDQNPMKDEVLYAVPCVGYLQYSVDPQAKEPVCVLKAKQPGVEDFHMPVRVGIESGIMLINIEQWKAQNIEQKCLEIAHKWNVIFHDQDILSIACRDKVSYMSWNWNCNVVHFNLDEFRNQETGQNPKLESLPFDVLPSAEELHCMCQKPRIFHFLGDYKPWRLSTDYNDVYRTTYDNWRPYLAKWLKNYAKMIKCFKSAKSHKS